MKLTNEQMIEALKSAGYSVKKQVKKTPKTVATIDYSKRNYAMVEFSSNKKLSSDKSFSTVSGSHKTCPTSCPFIKTATQKNGCYGDNHGINYHFDAIGVTKGLNEFELFDKLQLLPKGKKVRLFDVGDLPNINGTIDLDFLHELNRVVVARRLAVIQYTHNKLTYSNIDAIKSLDYIVNFSTEHLRQSVYALNNGVNAVIVLPSDTPPRKVIKHGKTSVLTCPAQWNDLNLSKKEVTCADCMLCSKDRVKERIIIGFYAHGTGSKKIDNAINNTL